MKQLKMHSPNLTQENVVKLAELFPTCVTESQAADGSLKRAIDFELLRQELSGSIVEGPQERYQLNWPGKREALFAANAPITKTLRPCREDSVDFDTTNNLFIEGDNLEVLKLLQETYLNKVKLIYIDPPYNTGNDFLYNDVFAEEIESFLHRSNQRDETGNRMVANTEANGRFHSDWLSMMYPRLKLAKNLLSNDGVIFISIDDGEVANLRKLCDEVFGDSNFISNIIWQKKYAKQNDSKTLSISHDHILLYAKSRSEWIPGRLDRSEEQLKGYKNPDNDSRGPWQSVVYTCNKTRSERPNLFYPITNPFTNAEIWPDENRVWAYEQKRTKQNIHEDRLWWGADGSLDKPRSKVFLSEVGRGMVPDTLWLRTDVGDTQDSAREIIGIFGAPYFDTPKPTRLLQQCIRIANCETSDIVLDFFAGSGSTAHAVIALNASDDKSLRFIMVQLPEVCDDKSDAHKAGYRTISKIGMERIRRAGKKIKEDNLVTAQHLDVGFRVVKVDTSNMKDVYYAPDGIKQGDLLSQIENFHDDRTPEDLLFQVLLDWGIDLALPISQASVSEKTVFFVDGNALAACFDTEVTDELIKAIAVKKPLRAVFRDAGFSSDSAKINVEQIFKLLSPSTELRCI